MKTLNNEEKASNADLNSARVAKKNEFYTQYEDIEKEMNAYVEYNKDVFRNKTILCPCDDPEWSNFTKYFSANFERFGLKKLISTSYIGSFGSEILTPFEQNSPKFDECKHKNNGKIFIIDSTGNYSGKINCNNIQFEYLNGDGDFRSEEITKLLQETDIVITNPPFSLFRVFLKWIMDANKQFIIIGNINAVSYKEVFPLIKDNKIWLGATIHSGDRKFYVPKDYPLNAAGCGIDEEGKRFIRVKGVRWFTNIDHEYRHESMNLMTMADNLKYNNKLKKVLSEKYHSDSYPEFDYYSVMEIPISDAIPKDYDGIMGVPITFLDKYCPEQFEILESNEFRKTKTVPYKSHGLIKDKEAAIGEIITYARICIRKKTR